MVADQPPGLAAGQLRHIRVLLLGHDGRPGRPGVIEGDEPELDRRPQDDLLADPRQVDADLGQDERGLRDQVARRGAVDGIGDRRVETQLDGHQLRIQPQRSARERGRPVGRHGQPPIKVAQPLHIPQQRPGVGQQMMRQQHGLRRLQVGPPGHRCPKVRQGLVVERDHDLLDSQRDRPRLLAQVHPDQRRDLVVAGPPGPQPTPQLGARPLDQAPLQRAVNVLVGGGRHEGPGRHVGIQRVDGGQQAGLLVDGQQAGAPQRPGMGAGAGQVVPGQPPVEVGGLAQREHRLGGAPGEPAAPQPTLRGLVGHLIPLWRWCSSPASCQPWRRRPPGRG